MKLMNIRFEPSAHAFRLAKSGQRGGRCLHQRPALLSKPQARIDAVVPECFPRLADPREIRKVPDDLPYTFSQEATIQLGKDWKECVC